MEKLRRSIAGLGIFALLTSVVGFGAIAQAQTFDDVDTDHWAYEYVEDLYGQGVVEGYDDGTFGCDDTANRAEFSKIVALAFGFDTDTDYDPEYDDVDPDAWYFPYIAVLSQHGVLSGDDDANTVRPGDPVNRAEGSKMLKVAAGLETDTSMGPSFSDVDEDAWYYTYVETLYANSVVDGYGDGTFGPGDELSRCALAKMTVGAQNPVPREEEPAPVDDTDSTGDLMVGMGDVLDGATVPLGATGVELLNVELSTDGDPVEVNQMVFHRTGVGTANDFQDLYLYMDGDRLTTGRSVSTDTNDVTFGGLALEVDGTVQVTVVADFAADATPSNENGFDLESADAIEHNGTDTGGDFPVEGELFTLAGATGGEVTISRYGSVSDPTVGETDATIAKFQLEMAGEDGWFERVALRVKGTAPASSLSNFTLYDNDDNELAFDADLNNEDLMTFILDDPMQLERGDTEIFYVTADIGYTDNGDTVYTFLDQSTDLNVVGEVYGFGASVDLADYDGEDATLDESDCSSSDDASCVAVEGGQVTIAFNGPTADDVAVNANDTEVFLFSVTSQVDVEILEMDLNLDTNSNGLGTGGSPYFTDVKVVDVDSGQTVGSSRDPQSDWTGDGGTDEDLNYDESFYIDAGETRNLAVTLDVENNAADLVDQELTVTLRSLVGNIEDGEGENVTDIVPDGDLEGNPFTIANPTLDVALASNPPSDLVVKGKDGVEVVGFQLSAGSASDIELDEITVQGYIREDGFCATGTFTAAEDNSVQVGDVVEAIYLYDGDGNLLSNAETVDDTTGEATFDSLNYWIGNGQTERVVVVANLSNSATPNNGDNDCIAFDIDDISADLGAFDEDGNALTFDASDDAPNNGDTPTRTIEIMDSGSITVAESDDEVNDDIAIAGDDSDTDPLLVQRFKLYANDEDFSVDDLTLEFDGTDQDSVDQVILYYPTSLDAPDVLDGVATDSITNWMVTFEGLDLMVPVSETDENAVEVEVYVTTNPINSGTDSGDELEFYFDPDDPFRAVGQDSNEALTENDHELDNDNGFYTVDSGNYPDVVYNGSIALYKTLPTFAQHSSSACPDELLAGTDAEVYCFSVTADVAGSLSLYQLTFDVTPTLLVTTNFNSLGDWDVYEYDASGSPVNNNLGSGTWDDINNRVKFQFDSEEIVAAGKTQYYALTAAQIELVDSQSTSSISVRLADEDAIDGADYHFGPYSAQDAVWEPAFTVWSDRSASGHDLDTLDWTGSYKVDGLPTTYLQLKE